MFLKYGKAEADSDLNLTLVTTLDDLVVLRYKDLSLNAKRADILESVALESTMISPRPCASSIYDGIPPL